MTRYNPDISGLKEIANSPAMQALMLKGAARGLQFAQAADPKGDYQVRAQQVTGGYAEEVRAGAVLEDVASDALVREGRHHTLNQAVPVIEAG